MYSSLRCQQCKVTWWLHWTLAANLWSRYFRCLQFMNETRGPQSLFESTPTFESAGNHQFQCYWLQALVQQSGYGLGSGQTQAPTACLWVSGIAISMSRSLGLSFLMCEGGPLTGRELRYLILLHLILWIWVRHIYYPHFCRTIN